MQKTPYYLHYKELFGKEHTHLVAQVGASARVIILSDSHLSATFDQLLYDKLHAVINQADLVILNGDFWEDARISFDHFLETPWANLFPLLLQKQAIYLFGNHDMPASSDERIFSFCTRAGFRLKLQAGDLQLHIEHGHLLSSEPVKTILTVFEGRPKLLRRLTTRVGVMEKVSRKLLQGNHKALARLLNRSFKLKRGDVSAVGEYFVMGHTHAPEFDQVTKYINSGYTRDGHFSYVQIQNNTVELIEDDHGAR